MKVLVIVLLVAAALAADDTNIQYGFHGCKMPNPDAYSEVDHYAWEMAIRFCVRTANNPLDDCEARLEDCRPFLHKLEFAIQEGLWLKVRQHVLDCAHFMDIMELDEDLMPLTMTDCPTLDQEYQMGFTIDNKFRVYKCVAKRIDPVGLEKFTACINGQQ